MIIEIAIILIIEIAHNLKYELIKEFGKYGWIGHKVNEHFSNREKDDPISL